MKIKITQLIAFIICIFFIAESAVTVKAYEAIDYSKVAQTSKLALYYNSKEGSIVVENLINGYTWSSSVSNEKYDASDLNDQWKANLKSLFNINYTNLKNGEGSIISSSSVALKPQITTKNIKDGISINYNFSSIKIKLTIDITIDEKALNVRIPASSIKEESDMALVSLEMLPFFGASKDEEEGYIVYPDGSGALMDFNDKSHYGAKKKSWNVYGIDTVNYMTATRRDRAIETPMVTEANQSAYSSLPVFGVKQGNNAFLAVITEGEADSVINLTPAGNVVDLNRISSEFIYRRFFIDPRVKKRVKKQYDKNITSVDHSVRYILLEDEQANYSGMANSYRNYLLDNKKMEKRISSQDKIPLGLDLFMGIKEKGLLFDKFIAMTNFEQAQKILVDFKGSGVESIQTQLLGWTKEGYNTEPIQFPPNKKLGGSSGLKELSQYTKNNNIKLFLGMNLIDADLSNGGFSKRNDVVYQGNGIVLTNTKKDRFILNPKFIIDRFISNLLPKAKEFSIGGISFDGLGQFVYYDYNKRAPFTRGQTSEVWNELLNKSNLEFGNSMAIGGNANILKNVSRLASIEYEDTGYHFTSESIPFYQMVVHGSIPYSGEAGNLSSNFIEEKLRWVEYGYMPYFELTYETADKLKYTRYNKLFTSHYKDWVETAANTYKEMNKRLGEVWSQYMVKHEKLQKGVSLVTYSNGTKVYVNHNEEAVVINGLTIKAQDYLVVDKGGNIK